MTRPIIALCAVAALCLSGSVLGQNQTPEQMLKVKGGHELGETSERFFSEGFEKQALAACAVGDYKGVEKSSKRELKNFCSQLADVRQQASTGKRCDYTGAGDVRERRTDTFTFDGGRLVRVQLVFAAPSAEVNYRGQSFEQIFAGLKQAYGPPTSESAKTVTNTYGVPYTAHRELWLSPQAAILVMEQPGESGSTTLSAFTRAEYDRSMAAGVPKPANPLQ